MAPDEGKNVIIHNHIIENRERLEAACELYNSFPAIQEAIVKEFVQELMICIKDIDIIKNNEDKWKIINCAAADMREVGIEIKNIDWDDVCSIYLGSDKIDDLANIYLGVWNNPEKSHGYDFVPLYRVLNESNLGRGRNEIKWIWWSLFENKYRDWSSTGMLPELKYDRKNSTEHYKWKLDTLLNIVTPELNKILRQ